MKRQIIRKLLVVLIIIAPVVTHDGCKKQAKCGCDGDVLFTLTQSQGYIQFNETGTSISFTTIDNPYSIYNFCNPSEMFPKFSDSKPGDILQVTGTAFWECNYLYQNSNSSYQTSYYKIYMIQVTNVESNLYGKK
jgi:hypothetical protein